MNAGLVLLLLLSCIFVTTKGAQHESTCTRRILTKARPPPGLNLDTEEIARTVTRNNNWTETAELLPFGKVREEVVGIAFEGVVRVRSRYEWHVVGDGQSDIFWKVLNATADNRWSVPFKDCYVSELSWMQVFKQPLEGNASSSSSSGSVGVFALVRLDRCDSVFAELFGDVHKCDTETTFCVPEYETSEKRASYWCRCREGFYQPGANDTWKGFPGERIRDTYSCTVCPEHCDICEKGGICTARNDIYVKTVIVGLQLACMSITLIMGLVVFKQRKCKTIASGMWTILETILLGIFLLYSTVIVRSLEPSLMQCLLEPWAREMGFVICYGAIILKLYRHLIEFRTRKAHRWVVKDTDLLKYLLIMVCSLLAYMAAYTSIALNFMQENYSLLYKGRTTDGVYYEACKPLWWDYVTQIGEITILIFGIHLSYASRNARTQFQERKFLCAAISMELAVSALFYTCRILVLPRLHPDLVLAANCLRTQLTATVTLLLVFVPKFWYQQKQVRSLAQEYSCRLPVDAFKDVNAHGPLTGNNSDVEVGEVTLADMSPDDIRAELKRLYLQLEILKSKTICRDNPHISKRRGGRKAQHRRFSLQNLYGKHRNAQKSAPAVEQEITEAEPSRTPEDSVCSVEGPSAVYGELATAPEQKQ